MLRSILSKRSLWVISGLVALHTRLLPIWSILGRKLRMLTVALPSLEAFEKKKLLIKSGYFLIISGIQNFNYPNEIFVFSILAIFGWLLAYSCQCGPILGRKLRMLTVAFPSLEAFFTRSKLNESAFYYILISLGYLISLRRTAIC